ncbi:hypothetical protein M407DRAFT_31573 [Tulasnella calospora MUT 4182]|uniref:VWFA domain-containing protein n=1 Tax=Tulasnella calospora MUT 4182 TaxID=1051891 RepID=A0A0C3Q5D5_9AGAM|nr:hypothetical protein M407DRAFT_31573 [Tulasnella calospora MUT 4182]
MNALREGSYKTISKINFTTLDTVPIKPLGIYGSKSAIVQFLLDAGVVEEPIAEALRKPVDQNGQLFPYLRSGIYLLINAPPSHLQSSSSTVIHVIFWPEDATWNDNASPSVQKNRVTFMRYLTKLASDIRLLVSEEHAASFVWKYDENEDARDQDDESSSDEDSDADDRFVKFEVAKAVDEEEGVQLFPGFTFHHQALGTSDHPGATVQLIPSETSQAFLVTKIREAGFQREQVVAQFPALRLQSLLVKYKNLYLGEKIGEASIHTMFEFGMLPTSASEIYLEYLKLNMEAPEIQEQKAAALSQLQSDMLGLRKHVEHLVRQRFIHHYPSLDLESEVDSDLSPENYLTPIFEMAPKARNVYDQYQGQGVPDEIESPPYQAIKEHFLDVQGILEGSESIKEEERRRLIQGIHSPDSSKEASSSKEPKRTRSSLWAKLGSAVKSLVYSTDLQNKSSQKFSRSSFGRNDVEFLATVNNYSDFPDYIPAVHAIQAAAKMWIEGRIAETTEELARTLFKKIEISTLESINQQYKRTKFAECRKGICAALSPEASPSVFLSLHSLERNTRALQPRFAVEAIVSTRGEAAIEYSMTQLEVKTEDIRTLDDDPYHLPSIAYNRSPVVRLTPTNRRLLYIQLLDQGRRLLQILESSAGTYIYLDDAQDTALRNHQKHFASREDRSLFFATDEQTALLAIVYVDQGRSFIQTFILKDKFTALQQRGAPHELTRGYGEGPPAIKAICFFSGTEDICLLEESGRIRVFSLEAQAFRPGTVHLSRIPVMMQSSPDGSALILVERTQEEQNWQARVFHQATFGENPEGIIIDLPPDFHDASQFTISSLGRRSFVYLVAHSPSAKSLLSVALQISRIEAEYLFRETTGRHARLQCVATAHNSLVDCFSEVWDRFPVIPAIPREFTASRPPMRLTIIEYAARGMLQRSPRYFSDMTRDFIRRSPKPVGRSLESIEVDVKSASEDHALDSPVESCLAGEWFVEVICLIPVHIAIARGNRFVPLKDGRCREDHNNALLGLEVPEIIDAITLGTYEAILGSYMSTKPVRVVSSMGEQSVGKSFSLNHLVDTSFAGSAMRTTEGVWLSLCPTKGQLIIALDFEGVHSLERTAQEDMLLVLFNAAISNLIMFRNNFALNRNVANMFTSFQASTRLFDPQNNPNLFKGLLAIIIKDVVDSDKKEIVEEFRSKFNQIVLRERGENFITVLHDSQLAVMPWDVIQSKEFYTRFSKLSKHLFKQRATHRNAGEFLLTLKTLMAKLTAQDWGALDQTLIKHRSSAMQASLKQALILGRGDVGPFGESEGLKNYDTQEEILTDDSGEILCLSTSDDVRHESLAHLLAPFGPEPARWAVEDLCLYLDGIGEKRLLRVKAWIDSNISRFMPTDNPDIKALQRQFDELSRTLVTNLQLCLVKCNACRLPCLYPKAHSSGTHDCGTTHRCIGGCDFCDPAYQLRSFKMSGQRTLCGLSAGHDGKHICEEAAHVCGKPCHLTGKGACQKTCIKPIGHDGEPHICAANLHQCGEPCKLKDITLHTGESFSCGNTCVLPFPTNHIPVVTSGLAPCGVSYVGVIARSETISMGLSPAQPTCASKIIPVLRFAILWEPVW